MTRLASKIDVCRSVSEMLASVLRAWILEWPIGLFLNFSLSGAGKCFMVVEALSLENRFTLEKQTYLLEIIITAMAK